jgi:predicted nucleotidyltransferase
VDISNPFRSIAPTVDADVLGVLTRTHSSLTGVKVAELAGRSYAQVRSVLHRMVSEGVVDAERHGQAFSYRLNRDHVIAEAVTSIAQAVERAEQRIVDEAAAWDPAPYAVVVFGSFARRDGGVDSDLDVLLVRPDDVDQEHERWAPQRHELARKAERWTGNHTQILELSMTELSSAVKRDEDLVRSLRHDARVLLGPPIAELVGSGGIGA